MATGSQGIDLEVEPVSVVEAGDQVAAVGQPASSASIVVGSAEESRTSAMVAPTAPMGKCVFDCGPPVPLSSLTNTATLKSPRWMCNPCNNARKCLEAVSLASIVFS